jgi:beta-lactamase class A
MNGRVLFIFAGFFVLLLGAFFIGWVIKGENSNKKIFSIIEGSAPLRLSGFQYIKPVLLCDTSPEKELPETAALKEKVQDLIDQEVQKKNVDEVSVYFQDFKTDGRFDINKDEKFHPASIVKIPLMIAYFKIAESNPKIFSQKIKYTAGEDQNLDQEIKPKDFAKVGQEYAVDDLIGKMIKYSDNNALSLLNGFIPYSTLEMLYEDLKVPPPLDKITPENFDYVTTKDISYFFRVLYNSTYLSRDLSEKALKLLGETDYANGLVAGAPPGVEVTHKFGLKGFQYKTKGVIDARELHDCGIIYHLKNPFLLCVMTKSSASLPNIEQTIKNISSLVYQEVDAYAK